MKDLLLTEQTACSLSIPSVVQHVSAGGVAMILNIEVWCSDGWRNRGYQFLRRMGLSIILPQIAVWSQLTITIINHERGQQQ